VSAAREDADVETSSEAYARRFAGPVGAFLLEVQARTTAELMAPWPGGSVLDVGGGHGQSVPALLGAGCRVTVFGSDPSCAARVRPWVDAGQVLFESGDLLRLPFPDRSFDVCLSYRLLAHANRLADLVAELARVARHAVIVDYPSRRSVNAVAAPLFALKKGVEGDTRPFAVFADREIARAFASHGLRVTARRPQFFWPLALHRGLGRASLSRRLERAARGLRGSLGSPVILRVERA
jgi:SAM-dependent methyltransferase